MKRSALALGLYALLALFATHPLWQHLGDAVPGDVGDPVLNTYILAWDAHALVSDPLNLFNANIFYPLPNTLAYSENLIGDTLLALPVMLLTGQLIAAYNFTFLSSFVLSAFGMYLLVLFLTHQRAAAFIAGVAFAFAPYRIASLGHIQLLVVQWLPFLVLALLRSRADLMGAPSATLCHARPATGVTGSTGCPSHRAMARYAPYLFFWLQIAASLHGAAFAVLAYLIVHPIRTLHYATPFSRARAKTAAPIPCNLLWPFTPISLIPFLLFLIALMPLVQPYLAIGADLRAARPPAVALSFLAQPSDFLAAYPWNRLFGAVTQAFRERDGFTEEQTLFMGVVAPLLALVGLWKRDWRAWLFGSLLVAALLLATSPVLIEMLPMTSLMRVPARWGVVVSFALAGLCGLGLAQLQTTKIHRAPIPRPDTSRQNQIVFAVFAASRFAVCLLLFLEGFAAPIPLAQIGPLQAQPAIYHHLAQQEGHEAIIELPMYVAPDPEYPEGKRMYASALHRRPLVNGYSGFTPARQMRLAEQMKNFPDEASLTALRELGRQGVRYVIVHAGEPGIPRREWVQTNRVRASQSGVLRFVQSFGDNDLFEVIAQN